MVYKRQARRRRANIDDGDRSAPGSFWEKGKYGGGRFTFLSFLVIAICLVFIKLTNPDARMRIPALMLVCVGFACAVMSYMARRMK
jgi:hypothetical protein